MGIYLTTGQPGHGKTAYALDKAFQWKKEGRDIYVHGVKDLDFERAGFKYLEDPTKWQDLPDGSVVLLDECYTVFPNRNPGAKVPEHVEAMARHRHRGFDFLLIAQQGLQLDPFLRGLYEEHVHVRQTSVIGSRTKLKRWNQYQSNVQVACSDTQDWVRPKYVFDYYTSTTMVTTKRRVPMWARYLIASIVFVALVLFGIKHYFDAKIAGYEAEEKSVVATGTAGRGGGPAGPVAPPGKPVYDTPNDYAKAHLPRFASMPWTAPVYDSRGITTDPRLFCMATGDGLDASGHQTKGGCSCATEQGTHYDLNEAECRRVAIQGTPYNPYLQTAPSVAPTPVAAVSTPQSYGPTAAAVVGAGKATRSASQVGTGADQFARAPGYPTSDGFTSF